MAWRTIPTRLYPDSTEWRILLFRQGNGTRIVQTFTVVELRRLLGMLYGLLILDFHRDRQQPALTADLRRLGHLAGTGTRRASNVGVPANTGVPTSGASDRRLPGRE